MPDDKTALRVLLGMPTVRESDGLNVSIGMPTVRELGPRRQSIRDKLFSRMLTVNNPGPSQEQAQILPGYAIRPEIRKIFANEGGLMGVDITGLSDVEKQALRMFIDPAYEAENQGNGV
jgi:hypothetical protein